ncbi:MAG: lysophospholipase [Bradymonadia bacterium]
MTQGRITERGFVDSADGTRLFYERDLHPEPKAVVFIVHGFLEHCGRYAEVADRLVKLGLSVVRFDYRGHGQSGGKRGHCMSFDEYLADLRAVIEGMASDLDPTLPRLVICHSYGGLITLHALAQGLGDFQAAVFSSPFFGFAIKVPKIKTMAGKMLSGVVPGLSLPAGLPPETVSSNPEIVSRYGEDPLVGTHATARWLTETLAAHDRTHDLAAQIKVPVLMQQGGTDKVASAEATESVFKALGNPDAATYQRFEPLYHEIWNEVQRDEPLSKMEAWLLDHLPEAKG